MSQLSQSTLRNGGRFQAKTSCSDCTIAGIGWVNGVRGYTFTATVTNGNSDRFAITINKPNGSLYYRAAATRLDGGEVFVVPLP
jgi:hypothetical protein